MYAIFGKRKLKGLYFSYEDARSVLRKILRANGVTANYSNPLIAGSGYTIRRVEE